MGEMSVGSGSGLETASATLAAVFVDDTGTAAGLSTANRGVQAKVATRRRSARLSFLGAWMVISQFYPV
jgi:hypothetical protein